MVKNTLPNKSGNPESKNPRKIIIAVGKLFNLCAHSWWGFAEGVLEVVLFKVLRLKLSVKKICAAEFYKEFEWDFYMKIILTNYNSYKSSYKFTFIPFFSFHRNRKQESNFQQLGGLVTRNSFALCLYWVTLYFKGMSNLLDINKRIFLHVIPVCITVPARIMPKENWFLRIHF